MGARLGVLGLTAYLSAMASGQAAGLPGVHERDAPKGDAAAWVRVRGQRVNIRSRPDRNSLVVARAEKGQVVRVVGREFGWHRIEPPPEVFSLVSAAHVNVDAAGRGVVSVERGKLRVRVGSDVRKLDPTRSEVQVLLARDAVVHVRERIGDWLKIDPPRGVFVYISAEYTEPVSETDARQWLRDRAVVLNQHSSSQPTRTAVVSEDESATQTGESSQDIDLSGRWGERLASAERAIKTVAAKPILDQGWSDVIVALKPIAGQREEREVAGLAAAWMAQLQQRVAHQDLLRQARAIARREDRARAQLERELAGIEQARQQANPRQVYVVRGELAVSYAFDQKTHPRRYRMLNPLSKKIDAYVDFPVAYQGNPTELVGKLLGIVGKRRQVGGLGVDVIDVSRVVVLRSGPAAARKVP